VKKHWVTSRWLVGGVVAFWAALAGVSLERNLLGLDAQALTIATERARTLFRLIETARLWNAGHGGVYVPATEATPPNPHLDVPNRDVTIAGRPYTLVNPAYMTRQLAELFGAGGEIDLSLTSLKPIRPQNVADAWEAAALRSFEAGARETSALVAEPVPTFRYMSALIAEEACLACHEKQGYKIGDVRGGISVSIPAALIAAEIAPQRRAAVLLHAAAFLILSLATIPLLRGLQRAWIRLEGAKAEQERAVAERTANLRAANLALEAEMAERRRIAGELEHAVGELRRSNAELEQFAYAVSHDLQEPLRMVNGYAQLLERRHGDKLDGDAREFLGFMVDGATRMSRMIEDLLAYSRVDRGGGEPVPVDAGEALASALDNLHAAIREAGAEVRWDPLPMVVGERAQLVRLFQNLIGNAVKYRHPDRPPAVHVGVHRDGQAWRFTVTDNGIGVPESQAERIFMVFQRLHGRHEYPGSGIGLAIARKIVERHGGRIWVTRMPEGGACFHFTLPAAEALGTAA